MNSNAAVHLSVHSTMQANATLRVNLAVQHLLAAAHFSRQVGMLEKQHAGQEFAAFWEAILHNGIACALTTVASLEAYANELFYDREKAFSDYSAELLQNLWTTYEAKPIVEKFEFALLLRKKPPLPRGTRPFQDVRVLGDLRNALTHFAASSLPNRACALFAIETRCLKTSGLRQAKGFSILQTA
jgi:hypothetical protein